MIMNMMWKNEVPSDFRKTLIKPLHKEGDQSEGRNYKGISLVSGVSKLLSNMVLLSMRDAIDKIIREEQCGLRKGRRCVDQIFTHSLIVEKCLSYQIPLVLSFANYE